MVCCVWCGMFGVLPPHHIVIICQCVCVCVCVCVYVCVVDVIRSDSTVGEEGQAAPPLLPRPASNIYSSTCIL